MISVSQSSVKRYEIDIDYWLILQLKLTKMMVKASYSSLCISIYEVYEYFLLNLSLSHTHITLLSLFLPCSLPITFPCPFSYSTCSQLYSLSPVFPWSLSSFIPLNVLPMWDLKSDFFIKTCIKT